MNETLERLDSLVTQFEIAEKGTSHTREMLEEDWKTYQDPKWLKESRERRRTHKNRTLSIITELAVADYLPSQGKKILNLGAWSEESGTPDIVFSKKGRKHFAEVKLIPESPEGFQSNINALKKKDSGFSRSTKEMTDYILLKRLEEAAKQLKDYKREIREVWLVFDCDYGEAVDTMQTVLDYLRWCKKKNDQALSGELEEYLSKVQNIVQEAGTLFIAKMKHWKIISAEKI